MRCELLPGPLMPVDGYLFGLNAVFGPIVTLPYDDPELMAAGRALGAGTLRWPGGAVANFWHMTDGNWHVDQTYDSSMPQRYYDWIANHPNGTFSPRNFWTGVGSAGRGTRSPVWVLNVHTLAGDEMLAQVDELHAQVRPRTASVECLCIGLRRSPRPVCRRACQSK